MLDVGLARLFPQVASRSLDAVTRRPLDCSQVWAKSAMCMWLEASGTDQNHVAQGKGFYSHTCLITETPAGFSSLWALSA